MTIRRVRKALQRHLHTANIHFSLKMATFFRKLELVVWKNFVIRRRHYIITLLEIAVPLVLFALVAVARSHINISNDLYENITYFEAKSQKDLVTSFDHEAEVLYCPNDTEAAVKLMENVKQMLSIKDLKGFKTERELFNYYMSTTANETVNHKFGVVFESTSDNKLKYKLRLPGAPNWFTSSIYPGLDMDGPMTSSDIYFLSGFLALQYAVDVSYMKTIQPVDVTSQFSLSLQQFPYPAYTTDFGTSEIFKILLPFFTVVSFLTMCHVVVKRIVEEKQTGAKELMKMMGLQNWMLWLGWFINAIIVCIISITVIVALFISPLSDNNGKVMEYSNGFLLWVFLLLYCSASVVMCFAISAFFNRPNVAVIVAGLIWLMSYSVPTGIIASKSYVSPTLQTLLCLLPNMGMAKGYEIIFMFEKRGIGANWANIADVPYGNKNDMSMLLVFLMLILDIVIYSLITGYVDAIMPGKYGMAKPWYFIFMTSFWSPNKVEHNDVYDNNISEKNFEAPPRGLSVGIRVENLRKVFSSFGGYKTKVAVDNVTLDIYRDQITALLGHNGAGKTTTMSMITGVFSSTSGSVYINGYDTKHNLSKIRESLGLCPQHSLLFQDLTVLEHLMFFGRLKGCSKEDVRREAEMLLQRLNLVDKKHTKPDTLSGGMKRKLSLGIALIGNSKVIILDEPTSGLDPEARREIWDLLLSMRGERTILITTHFMEEADVLGDRIAIMDHGRVYCYGTSLFLKKLYGTGYNLKLLVNDSCMVHKVTGVIQNVIPSASFKTETGLELCYTLPSESTNLYPTLFDVLEEQKVNLGITAIGMSITTLEEVFLRVGVEAGEEHKKKSKDDFVDEELVTIDCESESMELYRNSGFDLFIQQLRALFIKKMVYCYRKWVVLLLMIGLPFMMTILTVVSSIKVYSDTNVVPPRTFSLHDYRYSTVPFSVMPGVSPKLANIYGKLVEDNPLPLGTSVSEELLKIGNNIVKFREELVIAAEFNKTKPDDVVTVVNAMYSSIYYHAAPVSLNIISNTLVKYLKSDNYSVTTTNDPFPEIVTADSFASVSESQIMSYWLTFIPMGLLFLVGMFMVFPLTERVTSAKQLQLMTGVSPPAYWFICFIWDYMVYLFVAFLMVLGLYIADSSAMFRGSAETSVFLLILVLYGMSGITASYLFSYFRKTTASGFSFFFGVNTFIGLILAIVVDTLEKLPEDKFGGPAKGLKYTFLLLPHFALSYGLMHFAMQVVRNSECRMMDSNYKKGFCIMSPFHRCCSNNPSVSNEFYPYLECASKDNSYGIGVEILYLGLTPLLYAAIILLIDYGIIGSLYENILKLIFSNSFKNDELDSDVAVEQDRVDGQIKVQDHKNPDDVLLVYNLSKKYGWRFQAVKGVSFGVRTGECFGLLGVNGAGKTTTFKMLTGAERPSEGDALLQQFSLRKDGHEFFQRLGYCPQFDAFNETLTGREVLQLFAHLRGIPKHLIESEVNKWLNLLGLHEYEKRLSGTYSGGNKRKLSTAMALIGNPPVVLLDEPTSGVDPIARRNLWSTLSNLQNAGQSVVLTSHSMEECEALCNRLAIMVNGQFQCIGNIQYLKQKFGQGFTIMIKLRIMDTEPDYIKRIKESLEETLDYKCVLKDEHVGLLHYHVTDPNVSWKFLFTTMEDLKKNYHIVEDYTISETTLEQVFLSFAKAQK